MLAVIVGPGTSTILPPPQMHAPDGFLSLPIAAAMWLVMLTILAVAVRKTNRNLDERAVPLLGVTAAFVFAAQMAMGSTGRSPGRVETTRLLRAVMS